MCRSDVGNEIYLLHYSCLFRISLYTKADNFINFMSHALMTGRHNIHAMLHYFTGYYFNQCVTQSSSLAKRVTFKETDQALNFIHAVVCLCYLGLPLDAQLFFFLCIKSSLTHIHTQNTFSQFYYIFDAQLFLRPHRVSHFCNYFPPQESHLRHRLTSFSISH